MIKFQSIKFKNFLSFGDQFTEIDFTKSPTTLVTGPNGAGKSTFLDAITFVLYGKPFRSINKPQIINSINKKNLVVEIDFKVGDNNYLIRRGIKPNIFEIHENGELFDHPGSVNDYQTHLERNILKMNLNSFTQIVLLGKATYTPFMKLSTPDRRVVIEDLLGLKIFATMNKVVKAKISDLKQEKLGAEGDIKVFADKIELREKYIKQLIANRDDHLVKIQSDIETAENSIQEQHGKIENLHLQKDNIEYSLPAFKKLKAQRVKLLKFDGEFTIKMKGVDKEIKFLSENETCPTCQQDITQSFRTKHISMNHRKSDKIREGKVTLDENLAKIEKEIAQIENQVESVRKLDNEINMGQNEVSILQRNISKLQSDRDKLTSADIAKEEKELKSFETELVAMSNGLSDINEIGSYYTAIVGMLKDSGIKTQIIQKYLPIFNNLINQYLNQMGLFLKFELDEEFNETILSRYRDKFSYASFSEGQKLRIDLAILLTWREIAKMKNSLNTNLLILDEVFDSSLDQDGVDSFVNILPMLEDVNVYVISHTPDKLVDKFKDHVAFKIDQNFSYIVD